MQLRLNQRRVEAHSSIGSNKKDCENLTGVSGGRQMYEERNN
jgi:hypothetical protein